VNEITSGILGQNRRTKRTISSVIPYLIPFLTRERGDSIVLLSPSSDKAKGRSSLREQEERENSFAMCARALRVCSMMSLSPSILGQEAT